MASSTRPIILFCKGYNMPMKRYTSYFDKYTLKELDEDREIPKNISVILTHSAGLVKCILWVHRNNVWPKIIAMDPPDLDNSSINAKLFRGELHIDLLDMYREYLKCNINLDHYSIIVFKPLHKKINNGSGQTTIYYKEDTHYPYEIKHIRDKILSLI